MKIIPYLGFFATAGLLAGSVNANAQPQKIHSQQYDTYVSVSQKVPPSGTDDATLLLGAPNPSVVVNGVEKNAVIVVDLSRNILYHYDENGIADNAYLIASGKKSSPTNTGVRVVSHVESYPYRTAPASTKRRKQPWNYGPKAIILYKLNPKTGEWSQTGEFIHGNNDVSSIGKYASLGCMRMDNEVIKKIASSVKRGDIILIMRNGSYE